MKEILRRIPFDAAEHLIDFHVTGFEQLPAFPHRPTIIAFYPHEGHPDSFLVHQAVPPYLRGRLFYPAPIDYWYQHPIGQFIGEHFFNIVPLHRNRSPKDNTDFIIITKLMDQLQIPVISPQGTRDNPQGKQAPIMTGAAELVIATHGEIWPVILTGHENLMPKNTGIHHLLSHRYNPISARWLPPITFDDLFIQHANHKYKSKLRHAIRHRLEETLTTQYQQLSHPSRKLSGSHSNEFV